MTTVQTVGIYLTDDERRHINNVCSDLEIREEAALRASEGPEAQTYAAERAALRKLMTLPAALAADRERVRSVVREAIHEVAVQSSGRDPNSLGAWSQWLDAIATRAAEQLAPRGVPAPASPGPGVLDVLAVTTGTVAIHLTPDERDALRRCRLAGPQHDHQLARDVIDRLLGASK